MSVVSYLRGLAFASLGEQVDAAKEFREVLARRGNQPTHVLHALARLELARALKAAGDTAGARQAYADFAAAWRHADKLPLVAVATREAAALAPAPPTVPSR